MRGDPQSPSHGTKLAKGSRLGCHAQPVWINMLINAPLPRQTLESTAPKRVCLFFELKKIYKIQYVTSASEGDPGERKGPAPNLTNSEKCEYRGICADHSDPLFRPAIPTDRADRPFQRPLLTDHTDRPFQRPVLTVHLYRLSRLPILNSRQAFQNLKASCHGALKLIGALLG